MRRKDAEEIINNLQHNQTVITLGNRKIPTHPSFLWLGETMPELKMFEVCRDEEEEKKCGHCNWKVAKVYLMAESQEEADKLFEESGKENGDPRGLCGDCMCELLVEIGYTINAPKKP